MSTEPWRPSHRDPLFILAMDHRGSFGKTLFDVVDDTPTDEQRRAMVRAKDLIYAGLVRAATSLDTGRPGVLVDEQYGEAVIQRAQAGPAVLAVPIEASGHDWFTLEWGEQWLEHVRAIAPAYVKVLVRDNPDFDPARRERQLTDLAAASSALREAGFALLYELLVPATDAQLAAVDGDKDRYDAEARPALTVQVMADNQTAGVEPTLWKIEGLETVAAAQQVAAQARAGGRTADLIVLGRDAPTERLDHWLRVAAEIEQFVGFAIGRSIWEDTVRAWHSEGLAEDDAVERVAERYRHFVGDWAAL